MSNQSKESEGIYSITLQEHKNLMESLSELKYNQAVPFIEFFHNKKVESEK